MVRLPRHIIAGVLTVIFLVIAMGPLSILAMRAYPNDINVECTGDCDTCGCAPERMASHTCCCWQKKLKQGNRQNRQGTSCCKKSKDKTASITGTCRCGNNKRTVIWSNNGFEFLPFHFAVVAFVFDENKLIHITPGNPPEHTGEPPVPPHEYGIIPPHYMVV